MEFEAANDVVTKGTHSEINDSIITYEKYDLQVREIFCC
jgi:hypothetical protein